MPIKPNPNINSINPESVHQNRRILLIRRIGYVCLTPLVAITPNITNPYSGNNEAAYLIQQDCLEAEGVIKTLKTGTSGKEDSLSKDQFETPGSMTLNVAGTIAYLSSMPVVAKVEDPRTGIEIRVLSDSSTISVDEEWLTKFINIPIENPEAYIDEETDAMYFKAYCANKEAEQGDLGHEQLDIYVPARHDVCIEEQAIVRYSNDKDNCDFVGYTLPELNFFLGLVNFRNTILLTGASQYAEEANIKLRNVLLHELWHFYDLQYRVRLHPELSEKVVREMTKKAREYVNSEYPNLRSPITYPDD